MSGRITRLSFQKRSPDRVNVYLDGRFAFGLPALVAAQLTVGQQLGDSEIDQLLGQDANQRVYDRAVRFLSYRPRSIAEVRNHLGRSGSDDAVVEGVIQRLVRQGYLDDAEFARFWVDNRQRFRPRGERALRQELRQKGLDPASITAATEGLEAGELADRAARPQAVRLAMLAESDPAAFRQKLSTYLLRRGFDYDITRQVVTRLLHELGTQASSSIDEERE